MSRKTAFWVVALSSGALCISCTSEGGGGTGGTGTSNTSTSSTATGTTTATGTSTSTSTSSTSTSSSSSTSTTTTSTTTTTTTSSTATSTGSGGSGGTGSTGTTSTTGGEGGSVGAGGAGGSPPVGPVVVINEVVPDPASGTDWIELYNAGDQPADLTGWTLTDDDPSHVFAFAASTTIPAQAYLTLDQNAAGSFTFGLGKGGDQVNLYDDTATLVDNATWTSGQADMPSSWGRMPNGMGSFQTLTPTKGAPNQ